MSAFQIYFTVCICATSLAWQAVYLRAIVTPADMIVQEADFLQVGVEQCSLWGGVLQSHMGIQPNRHGSHGVSIGTVGEKLCAVCCSCSP